MGLLASARSIAICQRLLGGRAKGDERHQAHDNLASTICDFLTQTSQPGALLLTGEWGAGKSTFYRTRLAVDLKNRGRKPIYLSVAGASTIQEVEDRLFAAVYPLTESAVAETVAVIWRTGLRFLKVDPKDVKIRADLRKSMIICIDDLERFDGSPKQLFGFIQGIVEEERIPCLLIGEERALTERGNLNPGPQNYGVIREKIVAKSLKFTPSTETALDTLISSLSADFRALLAARKKSILEVLAQDDMQNLRSLNAAVRESAPILKIASDIELPEESVSVLLGMILASIFEVRRNNDNANEIYGYLAKPGDWLMQLGLERNIDHPVGIFLKRYASLNTLSWPAVPKISEYLTTGIFDRAAISTELELLKARSSQTPFSRLTGGDILQLSDAQFSDDQDKYYENLQSSPTASLIDLLRGASYLSHLASVGVTKFSVQETIAAHAETVQRHLNSGTLDAEDFDRLANGDALHAIAGLGEEGQQFVGMVNEAVPNAQAHAEAAARNRLVQLLLTSFSEFEAEAFDTRKPWRYKPLFVQGDPDSLASAIFSLTPAQMGRLREFLRWRTAHAPQGMPEEAAFLRQVIPAIRERGANDDSPLRRYGLLNLARMVEFLAAEH